MSRIINIDKTDRALPSDLLLVDSNDLGTKAITTDEFARFALGMSDNIFMHKNLFRGAYIGNSYTTAQKLAVSSGDFTDMYVGDYWTVGDHNYYILDFDYWYKGQTQSGAEHPSTGKHHLVLASPYSVTTTFPSSGTTDWMETSLITDVLPNVAASANSDFSGCLLQTETVKTCNTTSSTTMLQYAMLPNAAQIGIHHKLPFLSLNNYGSSYSVTVPPIYMYGQCNGVAFPYWDEIEKLNYALADSRPTVFFIKPGATSDTNKMAYFRKYGCIYQDPRTYFSDTIWVIFCLGG